MTNNDSCLIASERAGIGPCIDIKAHGGRLYAIQRANGEHSGRLYVLDAALNVLAFYEGVGNARQIEMVGDVAVITAREDGVFLFDVSNAEPKLLSTYHSVEYATGVALCGNLAFISCRQYGVEIIDISIPSAPRFVALVRVGEVQSAAVKDGYLYCGLWGEMKVKIVDVRKPAEARTVSEIPLGGRGDGVCVKNGRLYAATGQHARGIKNVVDPSDPMYGMGNGVEVFDVSDPAHPIRLNGISFGKAYCVKVDMWEAAVYGELLIVNDSVLGIYGLDPDTLSVKWRVLPPEGDEPDAVTGTTSLGGDLFFTTAFGDLFAVRGLGLADEPLNDGEVRFDTATEQLCVDGSGVSAKVGYFGNFPVLSICRTDSAVALAAAEGGVHLLDEKTLSLRAVIRTAGSAKDIAWRDGKLFVAEGLSGVEIFDLSGFSAKKLGEFRPLGSVHQLSVSQSGRYLVCGIGCNELKLYDVGCPSCARELSCYKSRKGIFYGNNLSADALSDGTMVAFCHRDGLITVNPDAGKTQFFNVEYTKKVGMCGYCAGSGVGVYGGKILYTISDGYVFVSEEHPNMTLIDDLPHYGIEEGFTGLLSFKEGVMAAAHRANGVIWLLDISELEAPKILARLDTNASPFGGIWADERLLVPAGRHGLLCLKLIK